MEGIQFNKTKIAIIGAGGFGREVKSLIDQINQRNFLYEFIGFYDDAFEKGALINNYPILGDIDSLNSVTENLAIVIAIGNPKVKKAILSRLVNQAIFFPTLIHPSAIVSSDNVRIGRGCIICANTIITTNIDIGNFVILNLMCTIGHDSVINDYCALMPCVNISGDVIVEESVYFGTGAKVINQLKIGQNSIIGAGAVVLKNIPNNCTAVGFPAKPIKFND
jgi:sugar O-acyltransferase (sialic acid O-acetyltransferase NeuD family)